MFGRVAGFKGFCSIFILTLFLFITVSESLAKPEFELTNSLTKDIVRTFAFYLGQKNSIEKLSKKFPELAFRAQQAQLEFDLVFSKPIAEMESLMEAYGKEEWRKCKQSLRNKIESTDISQISREEASAFIEEIIKRSKGEIQSPVLETLLIFNPSYWSNPLQEVIDGFQKEFKTDGKGKSLGLHLGLVFPASWEEKEARAPHIVRKFVGKPLDKNIIQCMLFINILPHELKDIVAIYGKNNILEYFTAEEVLRQGMPGLKILDTGFTTIAGEKTSWAKFSLVQETTIGQLYGCGIIYNILFKKHIIQLQYFVNNMNNNTEEGAKEVMEKYELLFKLLAFKLYIYDKFDIKS